jgi:hypothetical protein
MKWLYFRTTASISDDHGFISAQQDYNSELRTSALLKYDNLEAILPYTRDISSAGTGEVPVGGTVTDYSGVIMVFKACRNDYTTLNDSVSKWLARDYIYLEVNGQDSLSTCQDIIDYIEESSGRIVIVADEAQNGGQAGSSGVARSAPSVLVCKFIELAREYKSQ